MPYQEALVEKTRWRSKYSDFAINILASGKKYAGELKGIIRNGRDVYSGHTKKHWYGVFGSLVDRMIEFNNDYKSKATD